MSPPSEGAGRDSGLRRQGGDACREDLFLATSRETDVTQSVVERFQETKSRNIVTEMTSVMKTRVDDLDFSVTLPADAKMVSMVTLVIDPEAVPVMERMLLELGQLKVIPADIAAARQVCHFHGDL